MIQFSLKQKRVVQIHNNLLREVSMTDSGAALEPKQSFSQRWAGRLELERKEDARFQSLAEKYDLR
jgi:hypothetical protein